MFSLGVQQNYYLYRDATDMRKGFNGLSGLVRNVLGRDPLSGDVFVFLNRRRDRMKILTWESGGFVLFYKRLERGTFQFPPAKAGGLSCTMSWHELVLIVEGVELQSIKKRKRFRLKKTG